MTDSGSQYQCHIYAFCKTGLYQLLFVAPAGFTAENQTGDWADFPEQLTDLYRRVPKSEMTLAGDEDIQMVLADIDTCVDGMG